MTFVYLILLAVYFLVIVEAAIKYKSFFEKHPEHDNKWDKIFFAAGILLWPLTIVVAGLVYIIWWTIFTWFMPPLDEEEEMLYNMQHFPEDEHGEDNAV